MKVPLAPAQYEFTEKKSRFIAAAIPVTTPDEARLAVKDTRKAHPACRHVVHAFVIGSRGEIQGMSDDGEPGGTAGKPALEVLKGRGITNLVITIVRYFGGIKLGTGGLVRAYSQAARGVLELLSVEEQICRREFVIHSSYSHYEGIRKLVIQSEGQVDHEDFTHEIVITGRLPREKAADLERILMDFSAGQVKVLWGGESF